MTWSFRTTDTNVHETAVKLAVACRRLVQSSAKEDELPNLDLAFYQVIRCELDALNEGCEWTLNPKVDEHDAIKG